MTGSNWTSRSVNIVLPISKAPLPKYGIKQYKSVVVAESLRIKRMLKWITGSLMKAAKSNRHWFQSVQCLYAFSVMEDRRGGCAAGEPARSRSNATNLYPTIIDPLPFIELLVLSVNFRFHWKLTEYTINSVVLIFCIY